MPKVSVKELKAFNKKCMDVLTAVPTPDGFTREFKHSPKQRYTDEEVSLIFTSDDVKIRIAHYPADTSEDGYAPSFGTGHTDFKTVKGWLTFDRLGISDSFYLDDDSTVESVTEQIAAEIKRARERISHYVNTTQLPGIPFTCLKTPEQIAEIKAKLKSGQRVTLTPGGMGQGIILFTASPRGRFAKYSTKKAPVELQSLLGCSTLWMESFDHD